MDPALDMLNMSTCSTDGSSFILVDEVVHFEARCIEV
ncbi:hypothetical protein M8C21_017346 [Ambrosia artemisiifolia]|uniref:Uncharacterized protein n=1 Tax=Ambrosia artemisiifolia TaxID=4212 RepID=A0AAD5GLG2_AMBAR|nr:hypothetical protein M8C21_017346 [Ambrosia artemisiifolia]